MQLDRFDTSRSTIATRTGDVSYVDVGEGATALFVHGVGTNALLWRNVIGELERDRRSIALDLPLHGGSPARADQDFSLRALADGLLAFCDALGLDEVDLVANDTGGAVAQIFAARHPDRLRTFTLTNCETHDNVPPEAFKPTVDLARAGALAPGAPALLADLAVARDVVFAMGYENAEFLPPEMVGRYLEPVLGTPERARNFERFLMCARSGRSARGRTGAARTDRPDARRVGHGRRVLREAMGVLAARHHPRCERGGRDRRGAALLPRRTRWRSRSAPPPSLAGVS